MVTRVGIISDTHGLLRPEAVDALRGSDFIVHAGDIGNGEIISRLAEVAPVTAVYGNIDKGEARSLYPHDAVLQVKGCDLYVLHIIDDLNIDPEAAGFQVVVYGHSHKPVIEQKGSVLYLNPGSAGPRRFSLPVTVATLAVREDKLTARIVELRV